MKFRITFGAWRSACSMTSFVWPPRRRQWWDGIEAWARWFIANWIAGYRQSRCWTDYALWAMDGRDRSFLELFTGDAGGSSSKCHGDRDRCGYCYCGKLQRKAVR